MYQNGDDKIRLAQTADKKNIDLYLNMANRHGLIAGASGTGKTVTLRVLAESFSDAGVPVFLADMKGDLGGLCKSGDPENAKMLKRLDKFGLDKENYFKSYPCRFWDLYGKTGHDIKATIEDMGPSLLSRILDLSDVQSDVLNILFHIAEDEGWELINIEILRLLIVYVSDNREEYVAKYGNMSTQSLGAIQRALLALEDMQGDKFFESPSFDVMTWIEDTLEEEKTDGQGTINILNASELSHNPILYATFLIWLINSLFDKLPEVGDRSKPRLVFFFDEAHMLFSGAPKVLVQKVEQVVKLIRSKGVGIYFISQSPSDIPNPVLAQLSNRIQHALRAYTPAEQKSVKAAATAFRKNKDLDTEEAIMDLGVGEALISCLDEEGRPSIVERAFILPPRSSLKALTVTEYEAKTSIDEGYTEPKGKDPEWVLSEIRAKINKKSKAEESKAAEKAKKEEPKKTEPKKEEQKKSSNKSSSNSGAKKVAKTAAAKGVGSAATAVGKGLGDLLLKSLRRK